jgi:hypothetical protein
MTTQAVLQPCIGCTRAEARHPCRRCHSMRHTSSCGATTQAVLQSCTSTSPCKPGPSTQTKKRQSTPQALVLQSCTFQAVCTRTGVCHACRHGYSMPQGRRCRCVTTQAVLQTRDHACSHAWAVANCKLSTCMHQAAQEHSPAQARPASTSAHRMSSQHRPYVHCRSQNSVLHVSGQTDARQRPSTPQRARQPVQSAVHQHATVCLAQVPQWVCILQSHTQRVGSTAVSCDALGRRVQPCVLSQQLFMFACMAP